MFCVKMFVVMLLSICELWTLTMASDIKSECNDVCDCLFPGNGHPSDHYRILSISSFKNDLYLVFGPIARDSSLDQFYQLQLSPSDQPPSFTPLHKLTLPKLSVKQSKPLSQLYPKLADHMNGNLIYVLYPLSQDLIWITLRSSYEIDSNKTVLLYNVKDEQIFQPSITNDRQVEFFEHFIPIRHQVLNKKYDNFYVAYVVDLFSLDQGIWIQCEMKITNDHNLELKRNYIRYFGFEQNNLDLVLSNNRREGFKGIRLLRDKNLTDTHFVPGEWLLLSKPFLAFSYDQLNYLCTYNGTLLYFPWFNFEEAHPFFLVQFKSGKLRIESLFDCPANRHVTAVGEMVEPYTLILLEKDAYLMILLNEGRGRAFWLAIYALLCLLALAILIIGGYFLYKIGYCHSWIQHLRKARNSIKKNKATTSKKSKTAKATTTTTTTTTTTATPTITITPTMSTTKTVSNKSSIKSSSKPSKFKSKPTTKSLFKSFLKSVTGSTRFSKTGKSKLSNLQKPSKSPLSVRTSLNSVKITETAKSQSRLKSNLKSGKTKLSKSKLKQTMSIAKQSVSGKPWSKTDKSKISS